MIAGDVVVDASLALKWVLDEPYTAEANSLPTHWVATGIQPIAAPLLVYEATNVLYRKQSIPDAEHVR